MLLVLLPGSDIAGRLWVIPRDASEGWMRVSYNFKRLAVFYEKCQKRRNELVAAQVIVREAKEETCPAVNSENKGKVDPITRTCLTLSYSHIDIVNGDFAKEGRGGIEFFHFHTHPRVG